MQEIRKLESLRHCPTIDSLVKKLPGMKIKSKWSIWQAEEELLAEEEVYRVFNQFMEKEIQECQGTLELSCGCLQY